MTGDDQQVGGGTTSASFDDVYRAEYPAVVRLTYALTGRRDLAEELAQDAFLAAHRRWSTIAGYDDPAAWVRRVATNRAVSSGRRHVTALRLAGRLRAEREPPVELSEPADELWALVRALPRRQAQVLALAFGEDRSVADIATVLGCGEDTVRTHLRRGRLALAAQLRPETETETETEEPT